jgi:hypothetical protein
MGLHDQFEWLLHVAPRWRLSLGKRTVRPFCEVREPTISKTLRR